MRFRECYIRRCEHWSKKMLDSTESAKTQCAAFENIVDITTLFPGLRTLLLNYCCVGGATSMDNVSALWDRRGDPQSKQWSFWQTLAASSLSETSISSALENAHIGQLTRCEEDGLSMVEQLLIEHECS